MPKRVLRGLGALRHGMRACLDVALDVVVADACVLCKRTRRAPSTPSDPLTTRLMQPVEVKPRGFVKVRNHPVCHTCAAGFVRARGPGVLGSVAGGCVTTSSGERFEFEWPPAPRAGASEVSLIAPFMTEDSVLALIHAIKFGGYREMSTLVGGCVAESLDKRGPSASLLVAVPSTAEDEARRGFNLPHDIARRAVEQLGISFHEQGLQKTRKTRQQSRTATGERADNVRGAFRASPDVAGHHVIVVDDLVTTGATVADCAASLLAAGAASVAVACFGRAL